MLIIFQLELQLSYSDTARAGISMDNIYSITSF